MKHYRITRMALPVTAALVVLLAWPASSPARGQVTISIGGMTIRTGGNRGRKVSERKVQKTKDRHRDQRSRASVHCKPVRRKLQRCRRCGRVIKAMPVRPRSKGKAVLRAAHHRKYKAIVCHRCHRRQLRRRARFWFRWLW